MQERYGMGPPQVNDATAGTMQYALLPGTNTAEHAEFVPTAAKSKLLSSSREIAGCHPSRWVYELLNNKFTVCDMFDRARRSRAETPLAWQHPHRLVINGNQSYVTETSKVLSSVCLDCHYHLVFKMSWDSTYSASLCNHQQASWPLPDNKFPWHHLTWVGSENDPEIIASSTKYYPLLAREFFVCTAAPCTFELTLEVSEPRLSSWIIDLLQDHETILANLNFAREKEPSRYEGATNDWAVQAPANLNTYLKNLLESEPDQVRSISKRNKRFAVLFGPRCFSLFRHLEFEDNVLERDGIDEGNFKPPAPDPPRGPNGTTEVNTYRSFLEDVRSEVQCLIHKADQSTEKPTFCTSSLYADLGAQEVLNVALNKLVDTEPYKILGVLPAQSREIIVNAYKRQWDRLPTQRRQLVDALMAVANNLGDEQLSEYAITQSSVFDSQTQSAAKDDDDGVVSQALAYLGLQPPNNHSAEVVLQAFRAKVAASPGDAATARSMLSLIASSSTDDDYQIKLVVETDDARMSFETARTVLGIDLGAHSGPELIENARAKLNDADKHDAKVTILDAFSTVADHIHSPELKQGVADLRRDNNIRTTGPIGHSTEDRPVDWALPVGLNNIGNTCYLNSLLQYLYTVKAVRDIANNYDDYKLDLTDEVIQKRRLGGNKMQMDRGEAVVAQAFVHELSDLFNQLKTSEKSATRPSQRLANAVLLSTHSLLEAPKASPADAKDPQPPPLPARPSPAPPVDGHQLQSPREDSDQQIVPLTLSRNDSAETLVGHEEVDSEPSYEKVELVPSGTDSHGTPPVVEVENDEVHMSDLLVTPGLPDVAQSAGGLSDATAEQGDIVMGEVEEVETVDKRVLRALEHQKRSSGTDQQDVEEVIGSIINRLQAAIQPSRIDEKTGIQLEKIMETFFVTTVNYTKKFDDKDYQHEISFDRSITAFPASDGPCSLYDALGRNFDQQILEESKLSRYTAIKSLPPILHVLIQRSQSIGRKNGNPVVIPETLYLDRYMDAPHDSAAFRRRVEDWSIAARVEEVNSQKARLDPTISTAGILEPIRLGIFAASEQVAGSQEAKSSVFGTETWDFDGPIDDDFMMVSPVEQPKTAEELETPLLQEEMHATEKAIQEMMDAELQQLGKRLEQHREASKNISYRLHAVICHRGHLSAGHYWVWIRDFEDDLWRWYNDADVKENKNTEDVLKTLSSSGEPYYLCYVRDSDKERYVDVPKRQRPDESSATKQESLAQEESQQVPDATLSSKVKDSDGDVAIQDSAPAGSSLSDDWGVPEQTTSRPDVGADSSPRPDVNW